MFKNLSPNLMVKNLSETISFYKDNLGFELVGVYPETGDPTWAMLVRKDVSIMFQVEASFEEDFQKCSCPETGGTFTLHISLKGMKEYYAEINDKVEIVKDLTTSFMGSMQFTIKDNNGYLLTFAELYD